MGASPGCAPVIITGCKPTAVFVPVGEFFVVTCACSVGVPRKGSGMGNGECEPGSGRFVVSYINSGA